MGLVAASLRRAASCSLRRRTSPRSSSRSSGRPRGAPRPARPAARVDHRRVDLVACPGPVGGRSADRPRRPRRRSRCAAGALTLVDVTQAAGLAAADRQLRADYVVGGGYKWLLGPRGTCFFAVSPTAPALPELAPAGAGESRWDSIYGRRCGWPATPAATTSSAWGRWVGHARPRAAPRGRHRSHPRPQHRPRQRVPRRSRPPGRRLRDRLRRGAERHRYGWRTGVSAPAVARGRLRLSFHLYNSDADVEAALRVLGSEFARLRAARRVVPHHPDAAPPSDARREHGVPLSKVRG